LHPHGDPNDLFGDEGFNETSQYAIPAPTPSKGFKTSHNDFMDISADDSADDEGMRTANETSLTKKRKKKRNKNKNPGDNSDMNEGVVVKKESDSDEDPPPGPTGPRKPPKETGMERRARLRREKRKNRRNAKALRLKRPPDAAAGLLHDAPEPIAPEAVLFVPFPLPAIATVVQGSPEVIQSLYKHVYFRTCVSLSQP
jgi:hypothetical protein